MAACARLSGGSGAGDGGSSGSSSAATSNSNSNGGGSGEPPSERRSQPPKGRKTSTSSWLSRLAAGIKGQQPLRIVLNLMMIFLLLRFWPVPNGHGHAPLGQVEPVTVQVAFSEFVKQIQKNEVKRVVIDSSSSTFTFALRPSSPLYKMLPESLDRNHITFTTIRPADYPTPYEQMLKHNIQFSALDKKAGRLSTLLTYAVSALVVIAVLNRLPIKLLPQRGAGRRHTAAQSQAPIVFDDVAGVDEAKEELKEIVDFLRSPDKFTRLGARPPSGVLLVGPPGTGKTLLARAVAGEADVPFFSISASEFVELYVGMGAMRVRELFAAARKEAPAIVFIDEIDAVAKGRDSRLRSVGNDEREQTLNQLLTELDGFDSNRTAPVICIAATNRPDVLDAALLRPGRFDRRVAVERPDRQGREEILRVHINQRGLPLGEDVRVDTLAAQTTGFTGADLANLVNEAALLAGRGNKGVVSNVDFDAAILRSVAGIEKKRSVLQGEEKKVVARHEVGHALVSTAVAAVLPHTQGLVEKLSIIPRSGGALGFTYIPPKTEDRALLFDREIRGQLAMLMGGRAAEELTCEAVSTGAVDDIRRATELAYKAVSEYGLNANVGPLSVGMLASGGDDYSLKDSGSPVARAVEAEVKLMLESALAVARDVVTANRKLHDNLSAALTADERVEGAALQEWLSQVEVPASLKAFVLQGTAPGAARATLAAVGLTSAP
ncbi:ATP-dependent zinc metalloprotease FTSH 9, chloroplastic [Micractinium conductrix]|uniref:ATP-dependent zinc metalloprotease FTSH 9, chloroplastic n=1 Tax=Micractinium conductrix TaxID=554055 RepID=A0A2P6VP32_9CHLO|nr:ATP-dependent zinc metalloprotease FTSH 9, chloroplastic [Micractinium conductrix]|eukprot:PSC75856.1 ATP-dependent zinc metalloprotease FTSH 9, chloroplastic [Micractinium conductrix]